MIRCCLKLIDLWGEKVAVLLSEHSSWQPGCSGLVPQMSVMVQKLQDGGCADSSQGGCQAGQTSSFPCCCTCLVGTGQQEISTCSRRKLAHHGGQAKKHPQTEQFCSDPEQKTSPWVVAA